MKQEGILGKLSPRDFLSSCWQKRPLLLRGVMRDWRIPVGPDELFTLAGEPHVPSRLVTMPTPDGDWAVRRGPFPIDELQRLPETGWSLLVQEVDRRVDGFAELLERFRFVPNWRIDDVMVSFAPDGAGVGPHIDRYDVFLIQAAGRRRWRIADRPLAEVRLLRSTELPVLAEFEYDREWILDPGDMLYLPPRFAHEGVAVGDSLTCSIGFRAPDPRELCAGFLRQLPPQVFEELRYTDPELEPAEQVGEIPAGARSRLRESAQRLFTDARRFDRWLGCFVTTPQRSDRPLAGSCTVNELHRLLAEGGELRRSALPHFAWHREDDGTVQLFVGGEGYELGRGMESTAELLCGRARLDRAALAPVLERSSLAGILLDVVLRGYLVPKPRPSD